MNIENLLPEPVIAAYRDGRIAEASVAAWVERYRVEPDAAAATLATLAPGLPPGTAVGESAPTLSAAEAVAQLTGRLPGPEPAPPRASYETPARPVAPASSGEFTDADYRLATAALFPGGVGAGDLPG
jgi:hypothetical protein